MKNEPSQGVRSHFVETVCLAVDTFLPPQGAKHLTRTSLVSMETPAGAHRERGECSLSTETLRHAALIVTQQAAQTLVTDNLA